MPRFNAAVTINEWYEKAGPLPDGVRVTFGIEGARKALGRSRVTELAAMHSHNGARAVARAQFDGYVVPHEGGYVITCPDPNLLPRTGWRNAVVLDACIAHVDHLRREGKAWSPPNPRYDCGEWDWDSPHGKTLAIDLEGDVGTIRRFSVCNGRQTLTDQWNMRSRSFLRQLCLEGGYDTFYAHNAEFDDAGLREQAILELPLHCTMYGHQAINPWRPNAIGKCAQLYVPGLQPWKHKQDGDEEEYSLWDAAVCWYAGVHIFQVIESHKVGKHYNNLRRRATWMNQRGGMFGINGYPSFEAKAAGLIYMTPNDMHEAGFAAHFDWVEIMRALTGGFSVPVSMRHELTRRVSMGWGVRQARTGCKELEPITVDHKTPEKFVRSILDDVNRLTRRDAWRQSVEAAARNDGFSKGIDGQRAYGIQGGEAQRFQYWCVVAALQDVAIECGACWVGEQKAIFTSEEDRTRFEKAVQDVLVP